MTPRSHPTRLSRIQLLSPLPYRKLRTEIRDTISEIEDHIDLILTVATTHIKRADLFGTAHLDDRFIQFPKCRFFLPEADEFTIKIPKHLVCALLPAVVVKGGLQKGQLRLRIRWFSRFVERREFSPAAFLNSFTQGQIRVAREIEKWPGLSVLFAHEKKRQVRGQHHHTSR